MEEPVVDDDDHAGDDGDEYGLRTYLSTEQRTAPMRLRIDPGFVNYRLAETLLGTTRMEQVNHRLERIPAGMPAGLRAGQVNHVFTRSVLSYCDETAVPGLAEWLCHREGEVFCASVVLEPTTDVYSDKPTRVASVVRSPGNSAVPIELRYGTEHITSDTTRMDLHKGGEMAVVARLREVDGEVLVFEPIVMGGPWLVADGGDDPLPGGAEWFSSDFFEVFVEDIDEFSLVRDVPAPDDFSELEAIPERAVKTCLAEILGDETRKDWGGEMSDHYSAHLHLGGKPTTGAFLLKGPGGGFKPMGLNTLGKNNDQIYRLAQEPAGLLVVQHCHDILGPVRATLRAFAVQPASSRYYCCIDGRDTLRVLIAYDKLERARELSA